jgi:hypothetical protein
MVADLSGTITVDRSPLGGAHLTVTIPSTTEPKHAEMRDVA